jgi:hypothetical protein
MHDVQSSKPVPLHLMQSIFPDPPHLTQLVQLSAVTVPDKNNERKTAIAKRTFFIAFPRFGIWLLSVAL